MRLALDLNFYAGKKDHYKILGLTLPSDWDFYIRSFFQSGKRYTTYTRIEREGEQTQYVANSLDPYKGLSQSWRWVDFSFKKYFRPMGVRLAIFAEVTNLFNDKNSDIINPLTGRAYEFGDPVLDTWNNPLNPDPSPTSPFPFNPARYLNPRNVKLGVSFSW
ncbi:MAG TPA: hypothetical protein DEO84_02475 [candidate division Zixibacteria bacterium]|nr:hypothetical protein [candidate division Zixibacteria bacterium]